jgi:hypothetical protein
MTRLPNGLCVAGCAALIGVIAIISGADGRAQPDAKFPTIGLGLICSLFGDPRLWGLATQHSAQVPADYDNTRGGFAVGARRLLVELIVHDDRSTDEGAIPAAGELAQLGRKAVARVFSGWALI